MSHRVPRFREPTAVARDDAGVIAIVVALSISTFILGFAALAVDLGMAYERQSQLQSTADRLALAGAQSLPTISDALGAITDVLAGICATGSQDFDTKDSPGMCPTGGTPPAWMRDGNPANGEVTFYSDSGQTSLLADKVTTGTEAQGIQVLLPPSTVHFGFAGAFSGGTAKVTKSATARIGTPLGAGILPFALTPADIANHQWCVKTRVTTTGGTTPPPTTWPWYPILTPANSQLTANTDGQKITFTVVTPLRVATIKFYSEDSTDPLPAPRKVGTNKYQVTLPSDVPGAQPAIWATGTFTVGGATFTTQLAHVTYNGPTGPTTDPCARTALDLASRGYSQLARSTNNPGSDQLASNIRTGPQVREYAAGGLAGSIGTLLDCVSALFSPSTTCLSNQVLTTANQNQLATDMTAGLFSSAGNAPGRLEQPCPGDDLADVPGHTGAQMDYQASLLSGTPQSASTSLVGNGVSPSYLRNWIMNGNPPQQGWITSQALRCGRLAVMPVVDPLTVNGITAGQSIVSFTYVWIDDVQTNGAPAADRGVKWTGSNQVKSLQGYVIDPGYLPSTVAGSLIVGPYLGANMPKEALLVHDLGAPDA